MRGSARAGGAVQPSESPTRYHGVARRRVHARMYTRIYTRVRAIAYYARYTGVTMSRRVDICIYSSPYARRILIVKRCQARERAVMFSSARLSIPWRRLARVGKYFRRAAESSRFYSLVLRARDADLCNTPEVK